MRRLIYFGLVAVLLAGCVRINTSGSRSGVSGTDLLMIYGKGSSRPHEVDREVAEHWMTVYVTLSDSAYVFGHVTGGDFEDYTDGAEGRFRIRGGESRHFAIRDTLYSKVFVLGKGDYEFSGPAMAAQRAIHPPVDETYYSIATLTFEIERDSTVTAELVASSPNGFGPAR